MKTISDIRVVVTSLAVSVSDVTLNIIVSLLTGSTIMLAQALQGMSDLITGAILYLGVKRSKRKASHKYQFGHGREVFFWVLLAGVMMFVGTGAMSVYFGYQQIIRPDPLEHVWLAVCMLLIGFTTNGYAFSLSVRRLRRHGGNGHWFYQLMNSSIVETKATFLIDMLGTSSAMLGFLALGLYMITGNAMFDGLGAIVIGASMMLTAGILINDARGLIVGKSVDPHVAKKIIASAESVDDIESVLDLRTMYLGSERLLVILEVHVKDGLETDHIEGVVDKVKDVVKENVDQVHHIQVEIETPDED